MEPFHVGKAWALSITSAQTLIRLSISGPNVLARAADFLSEPRPSWGELELGRFEQAQVVLVRDEPPTQRYLIKVLPAVGLVTMTFSDGEARCFREALTDALADLTSRS